MDPKKAVDTVDHEFLLGKLSHIGIKNTKQRWLSCYPRIKGKCCKVSGISFNVENPACGVVPQGSCLGPLLFLLYVNDLPCALKCSKVTRNVVAPVG